MLHAKVRKEEFCRINAFKRSFFDLLLDYLELNCNLTPWDASGDEKALRNCPHETKSDIYCAHSEDVVVACRGDGDPTGVGAFKKEDLPEVSKRKFRPLLQLSCSDKAASKRGLGGQPGALFLGSCPSGCKWGLEFICNSKTLQVRFETAKNRRRSAAPSSTPTTPPCGKPRT